MTGEYFIQGVITRLRRGDTTGDTVFNAIMDLGIEMDRRGLPEIGREVYLPASDITKLNDEFSADATWFKDRTGKPRLYSLDTEIGGKLGMLDRFVIRRGPEDFPMFARMRDDGGKELKVA